jgi:hypothetical protein
LTYTPIRKSSDCATITRRGRFGMTFVSSAKLSNEGKLDILRRFDQFRHWHSLDEKRYCLVCGEIITGRGIKVIRSTRGNGPLRIICPTEYCNATPMEWVRPTEEVLIKIAMVEAERRRLCLILQAGRAMRSLPTKISRTRAKPPLWQYPPAKD